MALFIPGTTTSNVHLTYSAPAGQDWTVMCWGYLSALTPANYRNWISIEPYLGMGTDSNGYTFDAGTLANNFDGIALSAGRWYHMCETIRSGGSTTSHYICGYLNGKPQVINVLDTETFTACTGITIGNYATGGNNCPINGGVRDVRIWTRILELEEVIREMYSPRPLAPGLLLWSPFDDDIYTDKSGNGHLWTANGTAQVLQSGPLIPWSWNKTKKTTNI